MREDFLNIGEVKAFDYPVLLACYGLGSCIGLYLFDSLNKRGGGAHIMLAENKTNMAEKRGGGYAKEMIDELLNYLYNFSAEPSWIRAKIIGGAKVIESKEYHIGKTNIEAVRKYLVQKGVYIASTDLGGEWIRTGKFETNTGKLFVSAIHNKNNEIKTYYL